MNFAQLLFPDFALILAGFLLCRYTALDRSVWEPVENLVYYLLFPVLLFQSIVRSPLDLGATSGLVGAALLLGVVAVGSAYALPLLGRRIERRAHASAAQVAFRFNSFIGLAVSERLLGAPGLLLIAVLIGVCVPVFNVAAVYPMARHGGSRFGAALLRNPLIVATALGLAANLLGLRVPGWMSPTLDRVGAAAVALGLMAAGAGMKLGTLGQARLLTVSLLAIKHLVLPLAAFGLARAFALPPAQATILLLFSALPTASSCYVLASRMGYDGPYVAGLVTLSTMLGALSLSLALGVLAPLL